MVTQESVEYGWVKLLDNIHLEDQGRDGRMTVGQVLKNCDDGRWMELGYVHVQ